MPPCANLLKVPKTIGQLSGLIGDTRLAVLCWFRSSTRGIPPPRREPDVAAYAHSSSAKSMTGVSDGEAGGHAFRVRSDGPLSHSATPRAYPMTLSHCHQGRRRDSRRGSLSLSATLLGLSYSARDSPQPHDVANKRAAPCARASTARWGSRGPTLHDSSTVDDGNRLRAMRSRSAAHPTASTIQKMRNCISLIGCPIKNQILIKLRARKFELAGLDCADTGHELDHRMKEHVEKAMKSWVSGVQGALKRYEEIRREMMKLRGKGSVAADAYIPQRYPYAEVKFFALLELHHLHDLVEAWQRHSSAMLGSDGQIGWMNLPERPPPLCYGRIQILCGPVSPVANSLTGEAVDGVSDAASSDDDENGELEDAPVPQDIAFLAALDALEELVGDDA
ncbi:hypothetical protein BS47DRAFT_1397058 [Hydnum rufescens UP504]|uniref:Uncharacterized protein n=1 Tax=Hydnum rufescens UP504 TaxID=1448309 RepID=A0A9P6ANV2_9AGAM|nr:hypothetical protein BS47DRAFT_1397058 [Hydnum rufescens UP504]